MKTYNKRIELCKDAIDKWGIDSQLNQVIEECAELIKAIQKWRRQPNITTEHNIIEEVVDVSIMLMQIKVLFPHPSAWDKYENVKFEKLRMLLNYKE